MRQSGHLFIFLTINLGRAHKLPADFQSVKTAFLSQLSIDINNKFYFQFDANENMYYYYSHYTNKITAYRYR